MKKETLKKACQLDEDICDVSELLEILKDKEVDILFHAGGSLQRGLPIRFNGVIVALTKELLEGYLEDLQKEFDEL